LNPTKAALHSAASRVRAGFPGLDDRRATGERDARVAAAFALRDALRKAGYGASVHRGYFSVNWPDPASCFCGSEMMDHPDKCHYVPHVWVESGSYIVDVATKRFSMMIAEKVRPSAVEVVPLWRPSRWVREEPPGVRTGWEPGELVRRDAKVPLR
jgi:hypothetical protein